MLPSNEGRGYILRRLLRRSVRHLRLLGVEDPALARVGQQVVANLGEAWPELVAQRSLIEQVVASEEESFSRTLRQGSTLLEGAIRRTREQGEARLAGDTAFQLHDTYGFPYELTLEAAGGGRPRRRRRPLPRSSWTTSAAGPRRPAGSWTPTCAGSTPTGTCPAATAAPPSSATRPPPPRAASSACSATARSWPRPARATRSS